MALDRIDVLVDQKPFTWKLVNSLWIAPIVVGMGIFSLLGWLWAGILAKSPKVWRAVLLWGVVVALSFLSIALGEDKDSAWNALGGALFIISWFGSFAHALIIRGTVLREIVSREEELARLRALYGTHRVPSRSTTARAPPSAATRSPSAPPSAIPSEPALVDVNTAPSTALLGLPALDRVTVERIVAAREERGGFHDLNDLTSAAALQPHQLVALQGRVSFSRFRRPGTQVHGRILDL
ncbi:MAG: ComEA family DNA-binding protein [Actinomyces dentalis]